MTLENNDLMMKKPTPISEIIIQTKNSKFTKIILQIVNYLKYTHIHGEREREREFYEFIFRHDTCVSTSSPSLQKKLKAAAVK